MKYKNWLIVSLLATFIMITGCGKKEVKPVAIEEKNDKCTVCNMSVTNNQFATEVILDNGKAVKFADIGCMYNWMDSHKDNKLQARFVRDYNSKEWTELEKATFVYDKTIRTPMAYNVISFQNKGDAEKFLSQNKGEMLTVKDLENHKWEPNKEMADELGISTHHSH
ncbi:hypothetical protein COL60_18660 [Bacillus pseudomycoides]|uniref:nitrous oxide reductase accessory protein NosL n=1 Tax=Bacillus pseudomycoides TaxID=64104 RepID=UPI000BF81A27|nr:nitrous oxide reductase accessory protein NosL [Bacillus pseudomycoides]PFZ07556.1 hypothetical protein COL60_18660 [Bacillus pseudomycoides]